MKLVIAGGRNLNARELYLSAVVANIEKAHGKLEMVITGGAKGIDSSGYAWAKSNKLQNFVCPANWEAYGKAAGPIRNGMMADAGDVLLLIWDGKSRGSADIKRQFEKRRKPITEIIVKEYAGE